MHINRSCTDSSFIAVNKYRETYAKRFEEKISLFAFCLPNVNVFLN